MGHLAAVYGWSIVSTMLHGGEDGPCPHPRALLESASISIGTEKYLKNSFTPTIVAYWSG